MNRLYPKCHPYYNVDGKKVMNKRSMGPAYTSTGQILPCCFCDTGYPEWKKQFEYYGLWDEHLNIKNVNSILEIMMSDEWYYFHKMLVERPNEAPSMCKWKCGVKHEQGKFDFKEE